MRRILFYSENFCSDKTKGGLEVATYRIAKALKDSGHWEVYNAFRRHWDGKDKSIYKEVLKLRNGKKQFEKELSHFLNTNEIEVVVNMSRFFRHAQIKDAVVSSGKAKKIIFMQHFAPGSEMIKPTFRSGFHLLKLNPFNPLYWLRVTLYPLIKMPRQLNFSKVYKNTYDVSDRIVLLSKGYIDDYQDIANLTETSKIIAIPNIYESEREGIDTEKKDKRVLILSRMDEIQKRLSLSLQIWKMVEDDPELKEWTLDIVGDGHNSDIVKKLIKKLNLKNVVMHGWQPRETYLERSPILISTSRYEGLPLSILEAQAYGTVSIAFNSYGSLKDIITDGVNGVLIEEFGDIEAFSEKLKSLMKDNNIRREMARNAVQGSKRFSTEKVLKEWQIMLEGL